MRRGRERRTIVKIAMNFRSNGFLDQWLRIVRITRRMSNPQIASSFATLKQSQTLFRFVIIRFCQANAVLKQKSPNHRSLSRPEVNLSNSRLSLSLSRSLHQSELFLSKIVRQMGNEKGLTNKRIKRERERKQSAEMLSYRK
jgi:hypothetical protein